MWKDSSSPTYLFLFLDIWTERKTRNDSSFGLDWHNIKI